MGLAASSVGGLWPPACLDAAENYRIHRDDIDPRPIALLRDPLRARHPVLGTAPPTARRLIHQHLSRGTSLRAPASGTTTAPAAHTSPAAPIDTKSAAAATNTKSAGSAIDLRRDVNAAAAPDTCRDMKLAAGAAGSCRDVKLAGGGVVTELQSTAYSGHDAARDAKELCQPRGGDRKSVGKVVEQCGCLTDLVLRGGLSTVQCDALIQRLWGEQGYGRVGREIVGDRDAELAARERASLLYGEFVPDGVARVLDARHLAANDRETRPGTLVDLGMGLGKLAFQVPHLPHAPKQASCNLG